MAGRRDAVAATPATQSVRVRAPKTLTERDGWMGGRVKPGHGEWGLWGADNICPRLTRYWAWPCGWRCTGSWSCCDSVTGLVKGEEIVVRWLM